MIILGIETSCDETAIALYDDQKGLRAHQLYSQVDMHAEYGGVVPELASRDHIRKCIPLLDAALKQADISSDQINAVAYTAGPGLIGALMVGAMFARSLAFAWQLPTIAVHHLEAHLLAVMLEEQKPSFPFLALLVSGGHTMLMRVNGVGDYEHLGETLDDAAGEAFDKTAKMLGLGYPGGPALAKLAQSGDVSRFKFPRPMTDRPGLDFSFSGLKTFALNTWNGSDKSEQTRADIAAAFQHAVVDTFVIKCRRALEQTELKQLVIAGGVAANTRVRSELAKLDAKLYYPRQEFCTDNGAMVAYAGYQRFLKGDTETEFKLRARWPLGE